MILIEELLNDASMMANCPAGICEPERGWDDAKPLMVILASCHGRTLLTYFNLKPDFRRMYNIVRLETGPVYLREAAGEPVMTRPSMRRLLRAADVLVTYNMGASHGSFSLERVRALLRPDTRVVTFSAPNCSMFWPIAQNYCGVLAVMDAIDRGKSENQIIQDFDQGSFDPLFNLRRRIELGRIEYRDQTHDVKLAAFINRNLKTHKLFMSPSHPSFTTSAWIGSEIMRVLGHPNDTEEQVLAYNYAHDSMAVFPETRYEFQHFGFTYPLRHEQGSMGGREVYHGLIREAVAFSNAGGYCSIPMD